MTNDTDSAGTQPSASAFAAVVDRGWEFQQELRSVKAECGEGAFPWYPYDSLSNLVHMAALVDALPNEWTAVFGAGPILEVGAGDGDLGFFLEREGFRVHAVDHPSPNHNGMRGIRRLKQAFGSTIEIVERDLDGSFVLPEPRYEVGLMFGLLYHLKNPIHVLESLSRSVRFLFLSTRVARFLPSGVGVASENAVYLVGESEMNEDPSNYWIFSPRSLRRVLERSHWRILRMQFAGDVEESNPVSSLHDERAYCLLETEYGRIDALLGEGWHAPEEAGWRWTERRFSLRLPADGISRILELQIFIHERLLAGAGAVEVAAFLEGATEPLAVFCFNSGGPTCLRVPLPVVAGAAGEEFRFRFEASAAIPGDERDCRERCLIVSGAGYTMS